MVEQALSLTTTPYPTRVSITLAEPLSWLGPKLLLLICLKTGDLPQSPPGLPDH